MSAFSSLNDLRPLPIWEGIKARVVEGDRITFAVVELDANAVAKRHAHENEQLGLVLDGFITFVIGDETKELSAGETYVIPANVEHEATAGPAGAVVVDVFTPVRGDWHALKPQRRRMPLWP